MSDESRARRRATRVLRIGAVIVACAVVAIIGAFLAVKGWRHYRNQDVSPQGIAETVGVRVRGTEQFLFIRGYDRSKPVLLFLPGGPGESFAPLSMIFSDELARKFVVVHFESGGVGKSEKYATGPTLEEMVADTTELVDYLRNRFDQRAIYLLGHSFGSIIGLHIAAAHPEKVLSIATVGQTVDWRAGNVLAYEHLLALARQERNEAALSELSGIPPDLVTAKDRTMIEFAAVPVQRKWLAHYDLMNVLRDHTAQARWVSYLTSPTHSLEESCGLINRGPCRWIAESPEWWRQWKNVIPGVVQFDAVREIPALEMPYLAIVGEDDWVTPRALIENYVSALKAPEKRLIVIQGAQHYTFLDRPHEFQEAAAVLLSMQPDPAAQAAH